MTLSKLNLTEIKIIDYLKSVPLATGKQIARNLNLPPVTITRGLQGLRKKIGLKVKGDLNYSRVGLQEYLFVSENRGLKLQSPYISWNLKGIGLRQASIALILIPKWQPPNTLSSLVHQSISDNVKYKGKSTFRIWKVIQKKKSFSLIGYNPEGYVWQISWQGLIRWLQHQVETGMISSLDEYKLEKMSNLSRAYFPLLKHLVSDFKTPLRDLEIKLKMSKSKIQKMKRRIHNEKIIDPYVDFNSDLFGLPYQIIFLAINITEDVIKGLIEWSEALPKTTTFILSKVDEDIPSGIAIVVNLPSNQTPNFQDIILLTETESSVTIYHTIDGKMASWPVVSELFDFKLDRWYPLKDHLQIRFE